MEECADRDAVVGGDRFVHHLGEVDRRRTVRPAAIEDSALLGRRHDHLDRPHLSAALPRCAVIKRGFPGRNGYGSPGQVGQRVVTGRLPRSHSSLSTRDPVSDVVKHLGNTCRTALDACRLIKREHQIVRFRSLLLDGAISDV